MDTNFIERLLEKRANVNEQQREYMERIASEGRVPNEEDKATIERFNADYDGLSDQISEWQKVNQRNQDADASREILDHLVRPEVQERQNAKMASGFETWARRVANGEHVAPYDIDLKPAANFMQAVRAGMDVNEARAIYTDGGASGGSLEVPVGFQNSIYTYMEEVGAMRRISRVLTSSGGGAWTFPKTVTIAVGTQVSGQGTALAGTDPVMGTMRLDSFRYGELVKVSTQAARDTGFDLVGYIAQQVGYAVGRVADTAYVTGSGSGAPNGIITAASTGATTGGSLIALGGGLATAFTNSANPLIALQHSVAEPYAQNGVFVMNRLTAGTLRQLRDSSSGTLGAYIWTPTSTFNGITSLGPAGELLGSPVYTDFNFGTQGSAVKTVAFGDFSAYYIRDVGNFRFESSTERFFDTDEVGYRGVLETDADLIDTNAIKVLAQTP
jgi:HK97 family phage major capsid protein